MVLSQAELPPSIFSRNYWSIFGGTDWGMVGRREAVTMEGSRMRDAHNLQCIDSSSQQPVVLCPHFLEYLIG